MTIHGLDDGESSRSAGHLTGGLPGRGRGATGPGRLRAARGSAGCG
ncbi:hypothetical protein ACFFX0_14700 [Citricoccus parietis]|uniref:Uncharacterized protein n=1 Tax=Citricoccus parietis TaxID=592307 RepID=A0ABV5G0B1_9MICC